MADARADLPFLSSLNVLQLSFHFRQRRKDGGTNVVLYPSEVKSQTAPEHLSDFFCLAGPGLSFFSYVATSFHSKFRGPFTSGSAEKKNILNRLIRRLHVVWLG